MNLINFCRPVTRRIPGWIFLLSALVGPGLVQASNTNPTVTFQTSTTNVTNNAGNTSFSLRLYSLSGYTNITNQLISNFSTNTTNFVTLTTNTYSNSLVTFAAVFTNAEATALTNLTGTNGLRFDPTNGTLFGTSISTNFNLTLSQGGIQVVSTARSWSVTKSYSNGIFRSSSTSAISTNINTSQTTNSIPYTLTFQSDPYTVFGIGVFTNSNATAPNVSTNLIWISSFAVCGVGTNYDLPTNNTNGWTYRYSLQTSNSASPGYLTNTNQILFTNAGIMSVRFVLDTSNNPIWKTTTNTFTFVGTNPAATGFDFATATNTNSSFTATNLAENSFTPLVLSNQGTNALSFALTFASNGYGQLFITNGFTNVRALAPTGSITVTATRPATPTSAVTTSSVTISLTSMVVPTFIFVTNTNSIPFTRTNLTYGASTPLVLSNNGTNNVQFTISPPSAGKLSFPSSNGVITTNLEARSGTGNLTLVATRAATATSPVATVTQVITLNVANNGFSWAGVYSNTNTYTVSNPATTSLTLMAAASNGMVIFSTTNNTNSSKITNGNLLLLLQNGSNDIIATATNVNTNNYEIPEPMTNTLIVAWPNPAAPTFTSTNRQDGAVGSSFSYTLVATSSNTNSFPVVYAATNLPPGLVFSNTNLIQGTPTVPGLYRIQLTASNAGGVTTNILTSSIAPSSAFSVTNSWTNLVALGSGTNVGGAYTLSALPAGIGTNITNLSGFLQPVLVLSNGNTNTNTSGWFAGITNLSVVFSNAQTILTSTVTLNVRPGSPVFSITSSVAGRPGVLLSVTGTVSPAGIRNISGYPVSLVASNLPVGLVLNASSGVISGKPVYAGSITSSVCASNAVGSSTGNVLFVVPALAGASVQMSVAFTNGIGTYSVPNLPPGLNLNSASGLVTGNPRAVGTFTLVVKFVPSGSATTNTNFQSLTILPPAPVPKLPTNVFTVARNRPFVLQPWVTGPGWGWAGADPLATNAINANLWTNQLLVGTNTVLLTSNSYGVLLPTSNGLTFTNRLTNAEGVVTSLLWKSNLPVSWPWQAIVRLRIPGTLTNGLASPFLGIFPAQNSYSTNFYDLYAEGNLLSSVSGVFPGAVYAGSLSTQSNNLPGSVGTNEIALLISYATNLQTLTVSANTNTTNYAAANYVGILTNTGVETDWNLTNTVNALRIWVGNGVSNQAVTSNQIFMRDFSVLPSGVGFFATTNTNTSSPHTNLPAWLRCDPELGTLYGTPTLPYAGTVYLYATNGQGTNFTIFQLRVP